MRSQSMRMQWEVESAPLTNEEIKIRWYNARILKFQDTNNITWACYFIVLLHETELDPAQNNRIKAF